MTLEETVKKQIKEAALTMSADDFVKKYNIDIDTLIICEKRRRENSIRQIAQAMQMNYGKVFRICQECI